MKVAAYHQGHRINQSNSRNDSTQSAQNIKEEFLAQFFDAHGNLRNEFQKVSYQDGGEYIGQYQECRVGRGIYSFPNKDIYMGSWKEDRFNGEGLYLYGNG